MITEKLAYLPFLLRVRLSVLDVSPGHSDFARGFNRERANIQFLDIGVTQRPFKNGDLVNGTIKVKGVSD